MADETSKKKGKSKSDANLPAPRTRKRSAVSMESIDVPAAGPAPSAAAPKRRATAKTATVANSKTAAKKKPATRSRAAARPKAAPAETTVVPEPTPSASTAAVPPNPAPTPTLTPAYVPPMDTGGPIAEAYIETAIRRARCGLRATVRLGFIFWGVLSAYLGYITQGFASNLEPIEAATITQGIVQSHLDDYIPEVKRQIKEQIPVLIAKVPDYAKEQLPKYRQTLEDRLAKGIQDYADQTSPAFGADLDKFFIDNKDSVHQLLINSKDPQAMTTLGTNLKQTFIDYLSQTKLGDETLKAKIDASLSDLTAIDARVARLAANKNLTENEKRARRAISILLRSVDENPQLKQAAELVQSIDTTPMNGVLQFKSPDEAVFQAPGKPPMVFIRKKEAPPVVPPLKGKVL